MPSMTWFTEPWEGPVEFGFSATQFDAHTGQAVVWDDEAKIWRCDGCLMAAPNHHAFCAQA